MRLFVAAYPPVTALDHLAAQVQVLALGKASASGLNVRLAARSLWHITLAFLGEVDPEQAGSAAVAVQAAAARQPPVTGLRITGGGRFGRGRFTVVWAGVSADPALPALSGLIRAQLRKARLPYAPKPFRPHLTVARPGERIAAAELADDLMTLHAYQGPLWNLTDLHLVRSVLGPHPVHESIGVYPLIGR